MQDSTNVSPEEYFNYFCEDERAVSLFHTYKYSVEEVEKQVEILESRLEIQEEELAGYSKLVEKLMEVVKTLPERKKTAILELIEEL